MAFAIMVLLIVIRSLLGVLSFYNYSGQDWEMEKKRIMKEKLERKLSEGEGEGKWRRRWIEREDNKADKPQQQPTHALIIVNNKY